ncbi:hypothetical protein GCM10010967_43150 [Dyadobacter beijingensis]|uniref:Uncharacterized protein n=2 Tax=Dyadobacter beijingensis TaxID=365489 RepID=A0ABQ2IBG9_9BACT|nr:hypothetical protein GCM10010967_43150 [Dyadobacter beijingensis]
MYTMAQGIFQLKEDAAQTVTIEKSQVQEIIPDADFRFSLIILKDGNKHFVCGTMEEVTQELENTATNQR